MRAAVCVDDRGGMMFGGRRQSRDRILLADMAKEAGAPIMAAPYSAALLVGAAIPFTVADDLPASAGTDDFCFFEDRSPSPWIDRITELVIYRWNRVYPADMTLDLDPAAAGLTLVRTDEFAGSSHDRITKEVYRK